MWWCLLSPLRCACSPKFGSPPPRAARLLPDLSYLRRVFLPHPSSGARASNKGTSRSCPPRIPPFSRRQHEADPRGVRSSTLVRHAHLHPHAAHALSPQSGGARLLAGCSMALQPPAAPAIVEDTKIAETKVIWEYKLGCRSKGYSNVMTTFHHSDKVANPISRDGKVAKLNFEMEKLPFSPPSRNRKADLISRRIPPPFERRPPAHLPL